MFAHLRSASWYSFRHGTAAPARLVEQAADDGQPVLALTDRDGLHGAAEHVSACQEAGLSPALGTDLALAVPDGGRVVALARGARGWASLCHLVTAAHHRPGPVAVTREQLAEHHTGLVLLLGSDSDVGRALAQGRPAHARVLLAAWRATGAELALAPHEHGALGQRRTARAMVALADAERLMAVLTNAVRHPAPGDAVVAHALDRIRQHAPGGHTPEPRTPRAHLAPGEQMLQTALGVCAGDQVRARRLVAHTLALAASCALDPTADLGMGRTHLPTRPDARTELRARVFDGAARLGLDRSRAARERTEHELATVDRMGLWTYLLTIADAADAIRAQGIRCFARGSAVGSLLVHQLGISAINPLEHHLVFERFCTPSRPAPDIDLDVESARRPQAYDAVIASHNGASAAVAMTDTYRARSALRDAGTALSMPAAEVERIVQAFPRVRASRIARTIEELPELRALEGMDTEPVRQLVGLAQRLSDLPRHVAMHPCGLVLSDHTLGDRLPTQPSGAGHPMVQADKHAVQTWGLLKLDVLGVRMQSSLAHTLGEVERTTGRRPDLESLPDGDAATAHMTALSRTLGCFQTESPGQRELVSRLRPATIADLVADISLFRPGPMGVDVVSAYLAGRAGTATQAPHPAVEQILAETGGALLWHEQLLHLLDAMTGCGLEQAENMRRALGDAQGRGQVRTEFHTRAAERGHTPDTIDQVWQQVEAFAAFGFCRAHAAAFALVSYQSAWLKRHFPAAFFAGVLTHQPGMYPRRSLLHDARRFGVAVLPLDLHASGRHWAVERVDDLHWGLRPPLTDVGSLTAAERDRILTQRPYTDLRDLIVRARPSTPALDDLILVGALDALTGAEHGQGPGRRDVLLHAHTLARTRPRRADAAADQLSLDTDQAPTPTRRTAPMNHLDRLDEETRVLGYELSGHVLDRHAELLADLAARRNLVHAADLNRVPSGAPVTVAGLKLSVQTPPTRSGRRTIFASVEDRTGLVEVAMFPDVQEHSAAVLMRERLVVVSGRVRRSTPGALATITATRVESLRPDRSRGGRGIVNARTPERSPRRAGSAADRCR
ncbi:DNA polymerase III subunit alpha [Nocardiopsis alborubida]|uniref:DNA polymerase III subunit alpha n=1 Tax=Nocardiopsis alborubida TaxID=146802 RepID=A0A7X6RQI1_9ACTN|nr:DNA polymerase III subunit alpha [Nocardiopsis alborubida]NKY98905.1 DNA polymerase III subunit alpha [Nocardiopsis alborubida]